MHPDIVIVRTYSRSDILSTIPNDKNIITRQSDNTNDAPRDPLHDPIIWNPAQTRPYSTQQIFLRLHLQSITITASTSLLCQESTHRCIRYLTLAPSLASAVPCWQPVPTGFNSPVFRVDSTHHFFC